MNPLQTFISSISGQKKASPFTAAGTTSASVSPLQAATSTAPKPAVASQSPSAVAPAQQPVAKPVAQTPRDQYMASVAPGGLTEAQVRSNLTSFEAQNKPVSSQNQQYGQTSTSGNSSSSGAVSAPQDAFMKSYRDYLSQYAQNIKPSDDVNAAATKLAEIQSKIDERKLKGDQTYQAKLDQPGGTVAGAQADATRFARRENADLANLAVQESAAARSLSALTGARAADIEAAKIGAEINKPIQIGDKFYDPATGQEVGSSGKDTGFTLSPGEVRYDAQGNVVASGGPRPLTAAQEAAAIKQTETEKQAQQQATQSLGIINSLLANDRYKAISGASQTGSIPFLGDRAAVKEYDQLQGLLKLGMRGLLKGQGSVSDYEGKVLGEAASSLSRLTNEAQMKAALQKVRGVIKTNNGQVTSVTVKNPETGEAITTDLSGPEIYQLVVEGNEITYN